MITITRRIVLGPRLKPQPAPSRPAQDSPPPKARPRVPRISKLMALAIDLDARLRRGEFRTQQQLADMLHVSQPRLTQLLNLTLLAPDIQEALLFLQPVERGRSGMHERALRAVVAQPDWNRQRARWAALVSCTHR